MVLAAPVSKEYSQLLFYFPLLESISISTELTTSKSPSSMKYSKCNHNYPHLKKAWNDVNHNCTS